MKKKVMDMVPNRGRELTKNTMVIGIGRISTQLISFLLLPLYTALLSTEEYGQVDLVTTLVHLLVPVASLMIDQAVFRLLLNCTTSTQTTDTISSTFCCLSVCNLACLALFGTGYAMTRNRYAGWVLLILVATSNSNFFLQVARGLKRTEYYTSGSFLCSATTILLNIICIAILKCGAEGMLIATIWGNVICCLYLYWSLRVGRYISVHSIKAEKVREAMHYALPLVPNQLSVWVMNSSDKVIVSLVMGTAANGILAVSHKFPTVFMMLHNIFQLAWQEAGATHYQDADRDEFYSDVLEKSVTVFALLCMAILVFLPIVFPWFVNPAYHEAYYNIPIYLMASLLNVVVGFLGTVYVAVKKTSEIAKTTLLAALINITVHAALIRPLGLYAASVSTFVGFLITLLYRITDTKKYIHIRYNLRQYLRIGSALMICCIVYYQNSQLLSWFFVPFFVILAYYFNREFILSILRDIYEKSKARKI